MKVEGPVSTGVFGFTAGLVAGLAIAVAVALYLTNAPVPFINKVQRPTDKVRPGLDGKLPDPNKPLYTAQPQPLPQTAKLDAKSDPKAAPPPLEKGVPATDAPTGDVTRYLLQAGAFRTPDDADAMRARLALMGLEAKVFPIEQGGTTLYRVRLGPYGQLNDIDRIRRMLAENSIDAQVIRVK